MFLQNGSFLVFGDTSPNSFIPDALMSFLMIFQRKWLQTTMGWNPLRETLIGSACCKRTLQHHQARGTEGVVPRPHNGEVSSSRSRLSQGSSSQTCVNQKEEALTTRDDLSALADPFLEGPTDTWLLIYFKDHFVLDVWAREVYLLTFLFLYFNLIQFGWDCYIILLIGT